ncbi:NYN domain-containing protein [Microbacterium testaceum]|uniref:NYN domain-containing protein n=1 Tax=Microbacterium testaceum TaxID=2033 RepID=UPI0009BFF994|nr:NYN domain-containing protein [Microbacterium testaceum]
MEAAGAERLIVYIDGFNLYHGLHDAAGNRLLWLDIVKLATTLRPRSALVQVKYFTAIVLNEPDAQARQDRYIDALRSLYPTRLTVIKGQFQEKSRTCRSCGTTWTSYEEKQTDVNIAVHLVADVAANRAESFMLMTADTDIIPAVKMAWGANPDAHIFAHFPPHRGSDAIRRLMPASRRTTLARVQQCLLPAVVKSEDGAIFRRPEKWDPSPASDVIAPPAAADAHVCPSPPRLPHS